MSQNTNYFKLGLFIIGASVCILVALVFFGLGALRKDKIMLETYFNESVQGLDVGSPLKFKGVKIGSVERIRFVFNKYSHTGEGLYRYVLVEMSLDPNSAVKTTSSVNFKEGLQTEVENGLRVRIAPQGLTGTGYLEMDYIRFPASKTLPIDWEPEYYYVPSAPSTIARLEETFETFSKLIRKIEEAGVDTVVANMNSLLSVTRDAVKESNLPGVSTHVNALVDELRQTNANLNVLVGSKQTKEAIKNFSEALANIKVSTENLPQAIADLRKLLREVNSLVVNQREEVQGLLQQGKRAFENFNDLTSDAKRNPSRLFFGAPPAKVNPEKK